VFVEDDLIVELETHKAVVEVRAGQSGVLRVLNGEPGDWLLIDETLAIFSDDPTESLPTSNEGSTALIVAFDVT